jgi:CubicO group peptidase (beta-lactamase class C family)
MQAQTRSLLVLALTFAAGLGPTGTARGQAAEARLASDPRVAAAIDLLDQWIDAQLWYHRMPGLSVGVVHDQELVWAKGYGYAHLDPATPASPSTIYSICSISKVFTGLAVMQLRDAGALRLEDPVASHLDWFNLDGVDPKAPPVSILGVLTHSAGIPREADMPYWADAIATAAAGQPPQDFLFPTRDEVLRVVPGQQPYFPAWNYFQYSNLGLTLAGEIVAERAGLGWGDYVQRHILDPLGMRDTFTEMPAQHRGGRLATGYGPLTRGREYLVMPFFQTRGMAPAFGMASTVEDLARFSSWHFRTLEHRGSEVLGPHTLSEMHRVHWQDPDGDTTWGIGYSVSVDDGKTFVGHGGGCPGHRTYLRIQTREKIATIAMTNGPDLNTYEIARTAYRIVGPALRQAARGDEPPASPDPDLLRYVGQYGNGLRAHSTVIVWDGQLAIVPLSASDPLAAMTRVRHVDGHIFRRVRDDDELAEPFRFEVGPDGRATRLIRFESYSDRMD